MVISTKEPNTTTKAWLEVHGVMLTNLLFGLLNSLDKAAMDRSSSLWDGETANSKDISAIEDESYIIYVSITCLSAPDPGERPSDLTLIAGFENDDNLGPLSRIYTHYIIKTLLARLVHQDQALSNNWASSPQLAPSPCLIVHVKQLDAKQQGTDYLSALTFLCQVPSRQYKGHRT
ncbi:hypothetical protein CPB84DRAFT_1745595 [Gymnopilus junonius]|uniref:Uncharacterized protein n=1 Tax=Gymnopilus junonius TaxID=109634 RepID=A0A9P5NSP4_GYMJU|nr:hypothetical protein CPB84DRAFT_1745595 [Gymnopilus junonius]